jgi:hypothetical protein
MLGWFATRLHAYTSAQQHVRQTTAAAIDVQIIVDTKHLGFRPSEAPRRFKQKALGIAQVNMQSVVLLIPSILLCCQTLLPSRMFTTLRRASRG